MTFPSQMIGGLALLAVLSVSAFSQRPQLYVQTGHSSFVNAMAFSADGSLIASGSSDNTIKLWEATSGQELGALKGHTSVVTSVAFSPDGKLAASASSDSSIRLWDVNTGKQLKSFEHLSAQSIAFSPDGRTLISGGFGPIKIWEIASGRELSSIIVSSITLNSIALSPDGTLLAVGDWAKPTTVKLYDVRTGRLIHYLAGHSDEVFCVVFDPAGTTIASASKDNSIKLWDVVSGKELRTLQGHVGPVYSIAFSADGKMLASGSGDQTVKIWDTSSGQVMKTIRQELAVSEIAFSPIGSTLASGAGNTIRFWEARSGEELLKLKGYGHSLLETAFNSDGSVLVGAGADTIKVWDFASSSGLRTIANPPGRYLSYFSISPDGKLLAKGGDSASVHLWDLNSGKKLGTLNGHRDSVIQVDFSPDGRILATASFDKTIKLWDVTSRQELRTLHSAFLVDRVVFSPDGKLLVTNGPDYSLIIWEVATGQQSKTLSGHTNLISGIVFSPDGKTLASGGWDQTIKFWDVDSGKQMRSVNGHARYITQISFHPKGQLLASSSADGAIKLWEAGTGREVRTIQTNGSVGSVTFSPDGLVLAAGKDDGAITLWDVARGSELCSLIALEESNWAVVTPDGLFDGSPKSWSQLFWRFSPSLRDTAPAEAFFNEFYFPGLLNEILAGNRPKAPSEISQKDRRQPRITINAGNVSEGNLALQIQVTQALAGARDVRLFRNGSLVRVWRGDVLKGQASVTLETTIRIVAGENRLTAYAFNRDDIKSGDATLTIFGNESLRRKGSAYVLSIGVNKYANSEYDLRYALADAQDFSNELKRQQTKLNNFDRIEMVSLSDHEATKANILKSLTELAGKLQPEDALVIFFAGHGTAQQKRFYLIPHDLGYQGPRTSLTDRGLEAILAHSISDEELERAFEGIDAGQILLVIDACNSGQALESEEQRRGPMNSKGLAQLAYEKGMYILTASQSYQAAIETARLGHGYLTYSLVEEGLRSGAADRAPADGQVLLREWLNFATERVPQIHRESVALKQQGRQLVHKETAAQETKISALQQPRVFYRREPEPHPLVVARP